MDEYTRFCEAVLKHIPRATPREKEELYEELRDHLESRQELLMEHGVSQADARERVVAAMGDAEEIGKALNKEHKRWIGRLQLFTNFVVAIVLVFTLLATGNYWDVIECYFPGAGEKVISREMDNFINQFEEEGYDIKYGEIHYEVEVGSDKYTFCDGVLIENPFGGDHQLGIYVILDTNPLRYVEYNTIFYSNDGYWRSEGNEVGFNAYDKYGNGIVRRVSKVDTDHRGSGIYEIYMDINADAITPGEENYITFIYDGFGKYFKLEIPLDVFE